MSVAISYKWRPIKNLPSPKSLDPDLSADEKERQLGGELLSLIQVWTDQREELEKSVGLALFYKRLKRQWAIETGVIERLYTLDRGVTQLLIERGIEASLIPPGAADKSPELVAAMIRDHETAAEGIFSFVKGKRELSTSYIKELHAVLTTNQEICSAINGMGRHVEVELIRGAWKTLPNNPTRADGSVHEYCPPEQVASEMDRLIAMHREHMEHKEENEEGWMQTQYSSEQKAAWLHHRFTQIHPFQDGNGRVARCLATLIFLKDGAFPLVLTRDDREIYLDALESADAGNLDPLVSLFVSVQKRAFSGALSAIDEVKREDQVKQGVWAVRDLLLSRRKKLVEKWEGVKDTASKVRELARRRLEEVQQLLRDELELLIDTFQTKVDSEPEGGERHFWFRYQVIHSAKQLGYFADLSAERCSWVRLVIRTDSRTGSRAEMLFSFHGIGHQFRGVMACAACFFRMEETSEPDNRNITDLHRLNAEPFQMNYREDATSVQDRFLPWLEECIRNGLAIWRNIL